MDKKTQELYARAAKKFASPTEYIILFVLLTKGEMAFDGLKLETGIGEALRLNTALRKMLKHNFIRIDKWSRYGVVGFIRHEPPKHEEAVMPLKKGQAAPTAELYQYLLRLTGREPKNMGMEMAAIKNMLRWAHDKVESEDQRMFQAIGLVKDYFDYKVNDWIKANASQPAMLLQGQFKAYLSVIPKKPRAERQDERNVYGRRVGYDLQKRNWVVTSDKFPV